MKYLRKFDSVSDMDTEIASSEINIMGLAYNNGVPVMRIKSGDSPVPPMPTLSTPFYVENITNDVEELRIYIGYIEMNIEYSTDNVHWNTLPTLPDEEYRVGMSINPGDKIYLRTRANYWCDDYGSGEGTPGNSFEGSQFSKVGGNIMSLFYGENFTGEETEFPTQGEWTSALGGIFRENSNLIDASELIIPATANGCCYEMFYNCSSLTIAPTLPAETLAKDCYHRMFYGCSSLVTAPALPAMTLARHCYDSMFIYCSSLTTVPELPATTLVDYCYEYMFKDCTNLNYIKCLATNISASQCTNNWVKNVASTGTFVKNSSMSNWTTGQNGIPSGWTVQDATE